jgi:DedD protein
MAFFKFRTAGEGSSAPRQPESIEAMRRRARHRLIGATVLVLAGVVGFPLLFDTQPRSIPVDIPIEIPDRSKAKPLPVPRTAAPATVASGRIGAPPTGAAPASTPALAAAPVRSEVVPAKPETSAKVEPVAPPRKPEPKSESKPVSKSEPAKDEGNRAEALLEGKAAKEAAAVEGRFVVQVGAFADVAKAREARQRLEHAGLKTYTNVAETQNGRRIRVRVGPFPSRAEADKAARKIKGLDLPAAILSL